MALNKYSIEDLHFLFTYRYYLTKDRFYYYLKAKLALSDKELDPLWKLFNEFPNNIYNKELHESIDYVLQLTLPIIKEFIEAAENKLYAYHDSNSNDKTSVKLYYLENQTESANNGTIQELIFNYLEPLSLLSYAELMKRPIQVIGLMKFYDKFQIKSTNREELEVYEGDFFTTNDNFWRDKKSSIYLINDSKVYKLNYVPGKGYLKTNGTPNIDKDTAYSSYAITGCETWSKLGNIVKDINILKD